MPNWNSEGPPYKTDWRLFLIVVGFIILALVIVGLIVPDPNALG